MNKFVSTFEEACAKLGISTQLPDITGFPENLQKHLTATYKLSKILEVNNGDWKPNIADTKQWKYYPWFRVVPEANSSSGFGLAFYDCDGDRANASLGARLACASSELARFMGETFTDLYIELFA